MASSHAGPSSVTSVASTSSTGSESRYSYKSQMRRWCFKRDFVTASRRDGVSPDQEAKERRKTAHFMQQMCDRMNERYRHVRERITQLCTSAAVIHMHRFYMFHSFQKFDGRDIGAACLFLAAKAEECPKKLEHIVRCWYSLKFPDEPVDQLAPNAPGRAGENYSQAADYIITLENIILQTIAFDLQLEVPHAHVLRTINRILPQAHPHKKDLGQSAYQFAAMILQQTDYCVRHPATVLAAVCINLTFDWAQQEVPLSEDGHPWYFYVDQTLTPDLLSELTNGFVRCMEISKQERKREAEKKRHAPAHENAPRAKHAAVAAAGGDHHRIAHHHNVASSSQSTTTGGGQLPPPPPPPPMLHPPANVPQYNPTNELALKRIKTEPAVLDMNRYKERRSVIGVPESSTNQSRPSPVPQPISASTASAARGTVSNEKLVTSGPAGERKSFMPDMSLVKQEMQRAAAQHQSSQRTGDVHRVHSGHDRERERREHEKRKLREKEKMKQYAGQQQLSKQQLQQLKMKQEQHKQRTAHDVRPTPTPQAPQPSASTSSHHQHHPPPPPPRFPPLPPDNAPQPLPPPPPPTSTKDMKPQQQHQQQSSSSKPRPSSSLQQQHLGKQHRSTPPPPPPTDRQLLNVLEESRRLSEPRKHTAPHHSTSSSSVGREPDRKRIKHEIIDERRKLSSHSSSPGASSSATHVQIRVPMPDKLSDDILTDLHSDNNNAAAVKTEPKTSSSSSMAIGQQIASKIMGAHSTTSAVMDSAKAMRAQFFMGNTPLKEEKAGGAETGGGGSTGVEKKSAPKINGSATDDLEDGEISA